MKPLVLFACAATLAAQTGVHPKASPAEYAVSQSGPGATIAATVLTAAQAKKIFSVDLNKLGYTVVEIAVFPDKDVEVAARDFLLRLPADGRTVRAAAAAAVGNRDKDTAKAPKIPERVQVHGSETIGYETGPYRRGVYTATTVGVGIGGPPAPPPPPRSATVDTRDIRDQALPEGRYGRPVAGYLYFPVTPKKKQAVEITWYGADGQVRLSLPATK